MSVSEDHTPKGRNTCSHEKAVKEMLDQNWRIANWKQEECDPEFWLDGRRLAAPGSPPMDAELLD